MRTHEYSRLIWAVAVALILSVAGISCERAERVVPPPQAEPSPLQTSEEDTGGEVSEGDVIFVGRGNEPMTDSIELLPDSLIVSGGGTPDPQDFIGWVQSAYERRDAEMLAMILADDYVCTEITGCGQRSWGRETAIRIHRRMFNPACEVKPIANIGLELGNTTVVSPNGDPQHPDAIWTLRCEAHLVFRYTNAQDGIWEFIGPAEFAIRANPESPCGWELVAWHDRLPYDAE